MNKKIMRLTILLIAGATILLLAGCAAPAPQVVKETVVVPQTVVVEKLMPPSAPPAGPAQAARSLTVLTGAGKDTTDVNAFFPANMRVRAGDKVTWKLNSDEIHTVTFIGSAKPDMAVPISNGDPGEFMPAFIVPVKGGSPADIMLNPQAAFPTRGPGTPAETNSGAGYFSSGVMSNQPAAPGALPNNTFELTFTKPGTYKYLCLVHPDFMKGTVEVVPNTAMDVPSQAQLDAQAKMEMDPLLKLVDSAKEQGKQARVEPGPNNTNFVFVRAGNIDMDAVEQRAQPLEFLPKQTTIKVGDTVIWSASYFHTITFSPVSPPADFIMPKPQPQGPPQILLNTQYVLPAKPAPVYDPTKFFNSGTLTPGGPFGTAWALTFDKPGTYEYFCAVHRDEGMKGTIVVQPK